MEAEMMAAPDLEVCRAISAKSALPLQFVVKEFHVFEVLSQVCAHAGGSEDFVFKGGTALNKVYLSGMQRFSEDLDFDFECKGRDGLEKFCTALAGGISGYEIGKMRHVRDTLQFDCGFALPWGGRDNVRIDVAPKKILLAGKLKILPAKSDYAGVSAAGVFVYPLEDLVARKMNALRTRGEGKDYFDVYSALPKCGKMNEAIKLMLESEGVELTPAEFLDEIRVKNGKADAKKLRASTNAFIPAQARPADWRVLPLELNAMIGKLEAE
jgi:predicted nucleotidyltransferase component of viral defense system